MEQKNKKAVYQANWQDEIDSATLYRALSEAEQNPELGRVYVRLAEVEEEHAAFWEEKLQEAGYEIPRRKIGWRSRVLTMLAKRFGPGIVLTTMSSMERADSRAYAAQNEARQTPLPSQERSHARLLRTIAGPASGASKVAPLPGSRAGTGLRAGTP